MNRTAVWNACSAEAWYDPNGRSATTSVWLTARATPAASASISSTLIRSVDS